MEFTSIKNKSEIVLKGVTVEIERHDSVIRAITLTDADGNVLKINHGDYSGLKVMVPTKPKQVEKFAVKGNLLGINVNEQFDDKFEAEQRVNEINRKFDTDVAVQPVMVDEDVPF